MMNKRRFGILIANNKEAIDYWKIFVDTMCGDVISISEAVIQDEEGNIVYDMSNEAAIMTIEFPAVIYNILKTELLKMNFKKLTMSNGIDILVKWS